MYNYMHLYLYITAFLVVGDIYTSSFRSWFLGLSTPYLFKTEADKKVIQQLVSLFNQGSSKSSISFLCSYSTLVI